MAPKRVNNLKIRCLILGTGGVGAILRGIAYLPVADPPQASILSPIEAWMTITAWSVIWIVVGSAMIVSIWWKDLSMYAMTALTALCTMWGFSYVSAWLLDGAGRSWTTAALFLVIATWSGVFASLLERRR